MRGSENSVTKTAQERAGGRASIRGPLPRLGVSLIVHLSRQPHPLLLKNGQEEEQGSKLLVVSAAYMPLNHSRLFDHGAGTVSESSRMRRVGCLFLR
jgi:hypothetical protein